MTNGPLPAGCKQAVVRLLDPANGRDRFLFCTRRNKLEGR
jgi:hypothetical protein